MPTEKNGGDFAKASEPFVIKRGFYARFIKRPLDFIVALISIVLLSPLLGVIAIIVRMKLGSPVLFRQPRPGLRGRVFILKKFRSMTDARDENGELLPDEQRLPHFGKLLRSTSLDELPELFNILRGDMSFVGPRPLLVRYLPYYDSRQRHRHDVRPGLTGLAQINGRNAISWEEKFELDLQYASKITFIGDLKILFGTFTQVFRRSGISSEGEATAAPFTGSAAGERTSTDIPVRSSMRVWLMNHYATDMFGNKAGRHYWFAEKLHERGISPTVFAASTFHNKDEQIDTGGKRFRIMYSGDLPFVFVRVTPSKGNGLARIRNMTQFFFRLFPVTRAYARISRKPDVIIASSVHPLTMVAGLLIARRMGVPCICEVRDLWPEAIFSFGKTTEKSLIGRILTAGEHWIYRNADALIFTKEGDTDYIREKGWDTDSGGDIWLGKCHYINNGIDLAMHRARIESDVLDDPQLSDKNAFNVSYAGTIRPVNNVGNLLDCAALLKDYPSIHFLIFGDGSELEALRRRVAEEHLTNVHLKGYVNRCYIPYILSRSSVNILNYSQDQFNWARGNSSNKLFEYLASGKPVISTVRMGYSIIERWSCGYETESCTPEALASAILHIYGMPEEEYAALSENASAAAAQFDFNILTDRLMSVIDSVSDGMASEVYRRRRGNE